MALTTTQIQNAYVAFFNRPADVAGLNYWSSYQGSSADLLNTFAQSSEYKSLYANMNNTQVVNAVYQNLFNKAPDVAGLNYWVTQLDSGKITIGNVADAINKGAQGTDAAIIANKVTAASAFTTALDTTAEVVAYAGINAAGVDAVKAWLNTVGSDVATVTTATGTPMADLLTSVQSGTYAGGGQTYMLTVGADTITGTSGNDTINALTINPSTGASATTLGAFDSIDGGAGTDTLNIYTDTDLNEVQQGTVKNVEIINIYNGTNGQELGNAAGSVDASKFVGATQVWQIGQAIDVTKLGAAQTAGFKNTADAGIDVTADDAAASASVALDGVSDTTTTLAVKGTTTGILNSVTVSGTVVDGTDALTKVDNLALTVTVGKDVETLTLNTAVNTTLATALDGAGTKKVATINAGSSTGGITHVAAATVANITTGSGADTIDLKTAFTTTVKAASLTTGAGNDTLNVLIDNDTNDVVGATVTVDAGEGNDTITLNPTPSASTGTLKITLNAGAGDDSVTLSDGFQSVATTDVIDGGAGTDTVKGAGLAAYTADDYVVLTKVLQNFEAIEFTGSTAAGKNTAIDASKIAGYKAISFTVDHATDENQITKVAADQALATTGDLTATAAGYVAKGSGTPAATSTTYAGSLQVTASGGAAAYVDLGTDGAVGGGDDTNVPQNDTIVSAFADSVALTVKATVTGTGTSENSFASLTGDVKTASVTLTNSVDSATTPTADTIANFNLTTATTTNGGGAYTALGGLTSLTLSGNGTATIVNAASTSLVTVDASALGGTFTVGANAGKATTGLDYTSANAAAETIKLGSGIDNVKLTASTYDKTDSIEGLNLVLNAAKTALETNSDDIDLAAGATFKKFTTTQTDIDLALLDAAASADNNLVFQQGGNTYIYVDGNNAGQLDGADTLIKLVGSVDLDALIVALAS